MQPDHELATLDNPAGRLHTILRELRDSYGGSGHTLGEHVAEILGTTNAAELLHRSGLVLALPREVWDASRNLDVPVPYMMRKFPLLEAALSHWSLAVPTNRFVGRLDETAMHELEGLALHFHAFQPEPYPMSGTVDDLLDRISSLRAEVQQEADLDESLRRFVVDKLDLILQALDVRAITGLRPAAEAGVNVLVTYPPEMSATATPHPVLRKFAAIVMTACALTSAVADGPKAIETAQRVFGIDPVVEEVHPADHAVVVEVEVNDVDVGGTANNVVVVDGD